MNNNSRMHLTVPAIPLPDLPALNVPSNIQLPNEASAGEYEEIHGIETVENNV